MVGTKIRGFRQAYQNFQLLKQTPSAAYFTYRDSNNHLRYNYFQWFAATGSSTATLEMSVAGRAARRAWPQGAVQPVRRQRSGDD